MLGRFRLGAQLGAGGMGAVYRATDTHLGRELALKVLPPALAADPERRSRFEREARAACALNHPNIVTIYDAGVTGETPWIAMELVEGKTLRHAKLSPEEILPAGLHIARALGRAHESGIVHRDLKPENIMLTSAGEIKILDFGIARFARAEDTGQTQSMTDAGTVLGTPGYMSPEQVAARPVDHRSDQFSLGTILYELATGRNPFQRDTAVQTMTAILEATPEPPRHRNPRLDPRLSEAIERCLRKDPAQRYATTAELVRELDTAHSGTPRPQSTFAVLNWKLIAAAAVIIAVTATGWTAWTNRKPESKTPVLAVRMFRNIPPDPSREYFTVGMAEEIQGQISKIGSIRLLSRSAVDRYKEGENRRLAVETGADHIVEGTVRSAGDRVRISVSLISASTEQAVWNQQYDRGLNDALQVQSDVAVQIAGALQASLTPDERKRIEKRPTQSAAAYDLYLQARKINRYDSTQMPRAVSLLKQAIDIDPNFGDAMAEIAERLTYQPSVTNAGDALNWGERAVQASPDSSIAHFGRAMAFGHRGWLSRARTALIRSLEIDPNNTRAMSVLGSVNLEIGNPEEGLHWHRRSLERNPNSASQFTHIFSALAAMHAKEDTERWLALGTSRYPKNSRIQSTAAFREMQFGDIRKALDIARGILAAAPNNGEMLAMTADLATIAGAPDAEALTRKLFGDSLEPQFINWIVLSESPRSRYAYFLQKRGEHEAARKLLEDAKRTALEKWKEGIETPVLPMELAAVHALQNDKAGAREWLQRGHERGWRFERTLEIDPMLANVRGEQWFQDFVARVRADLARVRKESIELPALFEKTVPSLPPPPAPPAR